MTSTVGIATYRNWTDAPAWIGFNHEITNVRYSHKYASGGGPAAFTCKIVATAKEKIPGIEAGRLLKVWRGAENVWTGVISQPDIGADGIGINAEGIGPNLASRWLCVDERAFRNSIDSQLDSAIARGLPWKRITAAPTVANTKPAGTTLKDALDDVAAQTGYQWSVSATGVLTWTLPATIGASYILWAWGQGGARTLDGFGTDFYATYVSAEDYQISTLDLVPTAQSGTAWASTIYPKQSGDVSIYTLGASSFTYAWQAPLGTFTPANLTGYTTLIFYVAVAGAATVSRTLTVTLYCTSGPQWTLPTRTVNIPGNYTWTKVALPLTGMPTGFLIGTVRGFIFSTNGGIYLDDMWATAPQITPDQGSQSAVNKYGRYEINVDLTGQGPLLQSDAIAVAQKARDRYGFRTNWTRPFIATKHSLSTTSGTPVDLASVVAGQRVRVFLADLGDPEIAPTGSAVEFVIGQTDYDNDTDTLTLTPMESQRKDLLTLLGTLPRRKG